MKAVMIAVLSKIGCYCCHKAIVLAGHGYIKFEASNIPTALIIMESPNRFPVPRGLIRSLAVIGLCLSILCGLAGIAITVSESSREIVSELKREHSRDRRDRYLGMRGDF